jgi:hypothetical protein
VKQFTSTISLSAASNKAPNLIYTPIVPSDQVLEFFIFVSLAVPPSPETKEYQIKDRTIDNIQNCDSYINVPSSHKPIDRIGLLNW